MLIYTDAKNIALRHPTMSIKLAGEVCQEHGEQFQGNDDIQSSVRTTTNDAGDVVVDTYSLFAALGYFQGGAA